MSLSAYADAHFDAHNPDFGVDPFLESSVLLEFLWFLNEHRCTEGEGCSI